MHLEALLLVHLGETQMFINPRTEMSDKSLFELNLMVNNQKRSRTLKRIQVKTPGGRTVTHFVKPKFGKHHCAACGRVLEGVPRARVADMNKLGKTERRPERPYGGVLCSPCLRQKIITGSRVSHV